jgi:hypothetical protein
LILSVEWIGATRPPEVKTKVELTYRDALLDLFASPEKAKKAHDQFNACPHRPFQDWPRLSYYARRRAIQGLTANETRNASFRVSFE